MSRIDLDGIKKIHFIGVGGIGMSALARHFLQEKKQVSGSDATLTALTKALASEGVQIFSEQSADNITKDIDLVIYTEAMPADHEELVAAKKLKVPMMNYFEALGVAMNPYYLIAVAGTHGKTTTTAMLVDVFEAAEKDPTAIIGSLRSKTHSNYRHGKSKYAIVEACEYKRDFLHLKPDILVITNLEYEHADYYSDLADVQSAFREMAEQVNEGGVIVTDTSNKNIAPVVAGLEIPVVDYKEFLDLELPLRQPGLHNRMNAAAALTVAVREQLPLSGAREALQHFAGTWRRFEFKGEIHGAPVYDDYAHHPTEITATINTARELYPDKKIITVFQPHTHSRTKALFDDFAKAFGAADCPYFLPIYAARKEVDNTTSSRELSVKALEWNGNAQYVESFEQAVTVLKQALDNDSVLVVMGAGDVSALANQLVK